MLDPSRFISPWKATRTPWRMPWMSFPLKVPWPQRDTSERHVLWKSRQFPRHDVPWVLGQCCSSNFLHLACCGCRTAWPCSLHPPVLQALSLPPWKDMVPEAERPPPLLPRSGCREWRVCTLEACFASSRIGLRPWFLAASRMSVCHAVLFPECVTKGSRL